MKKIFVAVAVLAAAAAGCANSQNRSGEGAVVGGLVGAGAGAIIGHQSGHAGSGALIGGALGALTGAVVGTNMPKEQAQAAQPEAQQAQASQVSQSTQLSIDEIVAMAGQGISDDVIVDRIRMTNSRFTLTQSQVDALKQKGVSQKVINAMQGM